MRHACSLAVYSNTPYTSLSLSFSCAPTWSNYSQDPDTYEDIIYTYTRPLQSWYMQRAEVAKGMCKALTKGAKKAKKNKKGDAEAKQGEDTQPVEG